MTYIWIVYELCMNCERDMYELCINYVWIVYELCMNYEWAMYELCRNYVLIHEKYIPVYDMFLQFIQSAYDCKSEVHINLAWHSWTTHDREARLAPILCILFSMKYHFAIMLIEWDKISVASLSNGLFICLLSSQAPLCALKMTKHIFHRFLFLSQ